MKQRTKHVSKTLISISKTFLPVVVCAVISWVLLYGNSHVDSSNTYTVDCSIESIYFDTPYKGRSTGVITTTTGEVYEIYSVFLQDNEVDKLLESDRKISLVVWNYPFVFGSPIKTIVDMRSEDMIYHTIDDQNEYSKKQRIGYWCTIIPLLSVFSLCMTCLSFHVEFSGKIRQYRKRMIKKKKKGRIMKHNRSSL